MSYDPSEGGGVVFSAYIAGTTSVALPTAAGGSYTFGWDSANDACSIESSTVICNHYASTATCDIATGSASQTVWAYGFKNGAYYTGSHLYNTYAKGDDNGWGVHRDTKSLVVDTKIIFRIAGGRNQEGLDQLAGVII